MRKLPCAVRSERTFRHMDKEAIFFMLKIAYWYGLISDLPTSDLPIFKKPGDSTKNLEIMSAGFHLSAFA